MKTAVILAAGVGRKIWPFTSTRQKAALPLANKPLIRWQAEKLRQVGVENIIVVVGYRKQQVIAALAGMKNIRFVEQQGKGTVNALLSAAELVDDDFLLLYGDTVITLADYRNFMDRTEEAVCTALFAPLDEEPPQNWICAALKDDTVTTIMGHPRDDVTHRFAGMFAFSKKFKSYFNQHADIMQSVQVGMMPADEPQIEDVIQLAIQTGERVQAVNATQQTFDIDKPWHYLQANNFWSEYLCRRLEKDIIGKGAKVSDAADISGKLMLGENAEIGKGVIIEGDLIAAAGSRIIQGAIVEPNVILGERATVRRYCQIEQNSVIGPDCFIGHGAEVSGLLLRRVFAYHYGEFWGIIGDNSDLGAATVCGNLRFDDLETMHKVLGRRETPTFAANAAYLGDYVRTGVNAIIMPGVKVGPWSVIGAGAHVLQDVPDRTLLYVKQEQEQRKWGPEKYGW